MSNIALSREEPEPQFVATDDFNLLHRQTNTQINNLTHSPEKKKATKLLNTAS